MSSAADTACESKHEDTYIARVAHTKTLRKGCRHSTPCLCNGTITLRVRTTDGKIVQPMQTDGRANGHLQLRPSRTSSTRTFVRLYHKRGYRTNHSLQYKGLCLLVGLYSNISTPRPRKGMAEPFNEPDVQHEREEITVQARYTPCNGTATARVRTRPISTRSVLALCKRTRTTRVQKRVKGILPTHGAMVQPQHGTSTKRIKRALPVLTIARREYITRCNGTATARHEYKTGKTYITRADCAIVQPQHGTSTERVKRTLPVLTVARRESKTLCNGIATARHEYKNG